MDEFISDDRTHQKILGKKKRKSHIFNLSGYENAIKETGSVNPSNFSSDLQKKNSQQLKSCQQNVSCFLIRIIADGNLKGEKMNYKFK